MAKAFLRAVRGKKRQAAVVDVKSITQKEIRTTMNRTVKPALIKSHEKVVENWSSDVGFAARTIIRGGKSVEVIVFATGDDKEVWGYVNLGTRPHVIVPKQAPMLSFKTGYVPKTMAGPARTVIGGGVAKGPRVYAKRVNHPGSEGRNFTKQIAKELQPAFTREVENAFRRAARKVNRG